MGRIVNNHRVLRNPCTPEDHNQNWGTQAVVNNYVIENIINLPAEVPQGWFRFELTSTFSAGLASAVLLDAFGASTGVAIEVRDVELRYVNALSGRKGYGEYNTADEWYEVVCLDYIDPDAVFAHPQLTLDGLLYNTSTNTLSVTGSAVDSYTVKVTSADTTPNYLYDTLEDQAPSAYNASTDILVLSTVENDAADETVRLFMRLDATFYSTFWTNLTLDGVYFTGDTLALDYFMVRGQATADVAANTSSFTIDNIVTLGDSRSPGSSVTVYKQQRESLRDNDLVTAVYNANSSQWELLAVERRRLVRGQCTADVPPEDATFTIDHVTPLVYGLHGLSAPFDDTATLTIAKTGSQEAFQEDTWITAAYNAEDGQWELLRVERYRWIRGLSTTEYSASDDTFLIDNIEALASGDDPRDDPTDATETLEIDNTNVDAAGTADSTVYAVYNSRLGVWEPFQLNLTDPAAICEMITAVLGVTLTLSGGSLTVGLTCNGSEFDSASVDAEDC